MANSKTTTNDTPPRPLNGIRVLEMGQLLAGPFAAGMLAYFGAEVIKIEPPGKGDPLRQWRKLDATGTSYWWYSLSRNKKCITLDLNRPEGQAIARQLAQNCDVVIENFRPGVMEKWGLDPESLKQNHPELVYARVSGYGQTGPYADKPGFASVCEGFGGFRHVNGHPGQAPVRPNLSMGDTLSGMHAVIGILMSLLHKQQCGTGQVVDVAIYESVFNLMEGIVPEYSGADSIREPSGTTVTGIVPTNTYRCQDGKFVIIGGNGDSIFKRLMTAAGRIDMAQDLALADNAGRVQHESQIDQALSDWTGTLPLAEVMKQLDQAQVPAGPIYNVADMMQDPHYQARGLFEEVTTADGSNLSIPAIPPFLSDTPGGTDWVGPELGAHNQVIYGGLLGMSEQQLNDLKQQQII